MKQYPYKKVNAFTAANSKGNPAAYLIADGAPLTHEQMLAFGRAHAGIVSEVVFCTPSDCAAVKLTYYSSECEVDFCGHGTIAAMYDLISGNPALLSQPEIRFETNRKGILTVYNAIEQENAIYITAPAAIHLPVRATGAEIAQRLDLAPADLDAALPIDCINAGLRTLIVPVASLAREISIYPDLPALKAFCEAQEIDIILAFSMDTRDKACFAHTRVFAPRFGYLEDPATGSGNSAFANYLLKHGLWDGAAITVEQGGDNIVFNPVKLKFDGRHVLFGGCATVVYDGFYDIPDYAKRTVPFSPPDIGETEIAAVTEVLRSGWITTGPKTKLLEKKIAAWLQGYSGDGAPRCVCLNSATAALELSLRVLGIGAQNGGSEADEVITCAYTYTASASVIAHVGASIVLVDCAAAPGSIEPDYDALEAAITAHTKAIIPVDLAGIPCNYERIYAIIEKKRALFRADSPLQRALGRIAVVADCAHAFGAAYRGTMVGAVADFSCFSFHAVKNFTTAEGGAVLWKPIGGIDDGDLYHRFQLYSLHGQSKDALAKDQLGAWEYDIVGAWYKCNMTDIAAALGLAQLERYDGLLARRAAVIAQYDAALRPLGVETLAHTRAGRVSSGHLYITRLPGLTRAQANAVIREMAARGVATNVHYKPLPLHTAYKQLGFDISAYPNAYAKYENCITLPLHTRLTDEDVAYVIEAYSEIIKKYL